MEKIGKEEDKVREIPEKQKGCWTKRWWAKGEKRKHLRKMF